MNPSRGQVTRIKAPSLKHVTLYDIDESYYIIPNIHSVVLGGTNQPSYNRDLDNTDRLNIRR